MRRVVLATFAASACVFCWGAGCARGQASFPFTIVGDGFQRAGGPVFLNIINYQPLEPGQAIDGEIRAARVADDLRRLEAYRGGSDPVVLRVYPQPTATYPARMPAAFYDGVRSLGMFIIRDIYFDDDYWAADAIARGKLKVEAVIQEVEAAGALDTIFAWEIGNEFLPTAGEAVLENFIEQMMAHVKTCMAQPGRQGHSNWVTWASWPPNDPLRTDGFPIEPAGQDFVSYNAYSYDPERIRDHQAGPATGTGYAGYLAGLKARYLGKPLVVSECGLPDSPSAVGEYQGQLHPWYPAYRRGALSSEQVAEGLLDRYWDARLSGTVAGWAVFECCDEWHKTGDPWHQNDHPEEYFGLGRFDAASGGAYELRWKLQQDSIRQVFSLVLPADPPVLAGLAADDATLALGGETTVRATVSPGARLPVRFRWEASCGKIVGDGDAVTFFAGDRYLGPATVTAVGIDAAGRATVLQVVIAITPSGPAAIEALTLGTAKASGRVTANLDEHDVRAFIRTDSLYSQPYSDMTSIWVDAEGYFWTPVNNDYGGELVLWVLPKGAPVDPGQVVASATLSAKNDTDNDLLADDWENLHFPGQNLAPGRYDDSDADLSHNLEEFLAGTLPATADNDSDADGLPDNWERRYFGRLTSGGHDDPEGDGVDNLAESARGTHPGRTARDSDADALPDDWEIRCFGDLASAFGETPSFWQGEGLTALDDYERGYFVAPLDIAADLAPGEDWVYQNTLATTHDRHKSTLTITLASEAEPGEPYTIALGENGGDLVDFTTAATGNPLVIDVIGGRIGASTASAPASHTLNVTATGDTSGRRDSANVALKLCEIGDITGDGNISAVDKAHMNAWLNAMPLPGDTVRHVDLTGDGFVNAVDKVQINRQLNGLGIL